MLMSSACCGCIIPTKPSECSSKPVSNLITFNEHSSLSITQPIDAIRAKCTDFIYFPAVGIDIEKVLADFGVWVPNGFNPNGEFALYSVPVVIADCELLAYERAYAPIFISALKILISVVFKLLFLMLLFAALAQVAPFGKKPNEEHKGEENEKGSGAHATSSLIFLNKIAKLCQRLLLVRGLVSIIGPFPHFITANRVPRRPCGPEGLAADFRSVRAPAVLDAPVAVVYVSFISWSVLRVRDHIEQDYTRHDCEVYKDDKRCGGVVCLIRKLAAAHNHDHAFRYNKNAKQQYIQTHSSPPWRGVCDPRYQSPVDSAPLQARGIVHGGEGDCARSLLAGRGYRLGLLHAPEPRSGYFFVFYLLLVDGHHLCFELGNNHFQFLGVVAGQLLGFCGQQGHHVPAHGSAATATDHGKCAGPVHNVDPLLAFVLWLKIKRETWHVITPSSACGSAIKRAFPAFSKKGHAIKVTPRNSLKLNGYRRSRGWACSAKFAGIAPAGDTSGILGRSFV